MLVQPHGSIHKYIRTAVHSGKRVRLALVHVHAH
jgi:hypothetical protein